MLSDNIVPTSQSFPADRKLSGWLYLDDGNAKDRFYYKATGRWVNNTDNVEIQTDELKTERKNGK